MRRDLTYDVFLSYADPDRDVVEKLAFRLRSEGLKPYFDAWEVFPSQQWQEALEQALKRRQTFAILLGPRGLGLEMRALAEKALDEGLRVIPVLLPGASEPESPAFLKLLDWVDFRSGLDDPVALHHLIAAIQGPERWLVRERSERSMPPASCPPTRRRWRLPTISLPTIRLSRLRLPRFDFRRKLKDVWLATAAPPQVACNSKFVARFSAYTEEYRSQVTKAVIAEAPEAKLHLDLHTCQWEPGAKVTVTLSAEPLRVEEPSQSFVWSGKWEILKFDVSVPDSIDEGRLILKFDVFVEGLKIAKLRPELEIVRSQATPKKERELEVTTAPDKAFASYASRDRREVLGRVRSLQIFTRVEVFLDCLSIHPGEPWKARIKDEITQRDIFWLFWSRNALQSEWVDWEWRTALAAKALDYIQPHPLEGPDVAPPPAELAALQFGTLYESFLSQMRSSWWDCRITQCRRAVSRFVGSYWLLASALLVVVVVYFLWFR